MVDFTKKIAACVTAISKGYGHTVVEELVKRLKTESKIIVLTNADGDARRSTKKLKLMVDKKIMVETYIIDFTKPDLSKYISIINKMFLALEKRHFDIGMIVHNALVPGRLNSTVTLTDLDIWRATCDINLISPALLNATFVEKAKHEVKQMFVVNISMLSKDPESHFGMFNCLNAARNMYFQTLALEEPSVQVLNYLPGIVQTASLNLVTDEKNNPELKKWIAQMRMQKVIVRPQQSVLRLIEILEKGDYKSGDFVEYHDKK